MAALTLGELANGLGLELRGNPEAQVTHVAPLDEAQAGALSFCTGPKHAQALAETGATVVLVHPAQAGLAKVNVLLTPNPYLAYAEAIDLLYPEPPQQAGCHPSAIIDPQARLDPSCWVGAGCIVEAEVEVGAGAFIGPGSFLGRNSSIGEFSRLVAEVTICHHVVIGRRNFILPGAVIGGDGFGFAENRGQWRRIRQLGRVVTGDDVEIGANTTIDRGALSDTIIEDGAKLDNLIQIGHNVVIGQHTAIASCTGIAGSTRIGRHCQIGGAVGMAGHLNIADHVHFTGMAMVTKSVRESGLYSGNFPAMPNHDWRKMIVQLRRIEELTQRVKALEQQLQKAEGS